MNTKTTPSLLVWENHTFMDPVATLMRQELTAEILRLRKIEKAARKVVKRLDQTEMHFTVYKPLAELLT